MITTKGAVRQWRKSSHSGGGNDCVEVSFDGSTPALRDSKQPAAGTIVVDAEQWRAVLSAVRDGSLGA